MRIFDIFKATDSTAVVNSQRGALASAAIQVLGSAQTGGVAGIAANLRQAGLGDLVRSWVGTGPNLPISPEKLQQALGSHQISRIASMAGISPELAKSGLATILPILIDKATPHGVIPSGGGDLSMGLSTLLNASGKRR